ncbi:MAG: glycosyltransferase [Mycoplasmataceae bacterium]|nr:glycosyltransferase [Mycoplasmataceae bacterium]
MKLSIITLVYDSGKELERFLSLISEQTSKNFELILVIDTNKGGPLGVIEKFRDVLNKKLILIYKAKRSSRDYAINQAFEISKSDYTIVLDIEDEFSKTFVAKALGAAKQKDTDVIEFKSPMSSPIKYSGKLRKSYPKSTIIADNAEIFAMVHPFSFNKLIRTSVANHMSSFKVSSLLNSRYSIAITYKALRFATTYSTVSAILVTSKSKIKRVVNPIWMIKQWDMLLKIFSQTSNEDASSRLRYAQYYSEVIFMTAIAKATKNKVLIKKLNDKIKKQKEGVFKNILSENTFAHTSKTENEILSRFTAISSMHKAHKEIK